MRRSILSTLITLLTIVCSFVACVQIYKSSQSNPVTGPIADMDTSNLLPKSIDKTHDAVSAIVFLDSSDQYLVASTGTFIHPQIVLTAGHVNYRLGRKAHGVSNKKGYVALGENARLSQQYAYFDWEKDIVSHPTWLNMFRSMSDTTGTDSSTSPDYHDIGLLLLDEAMDGIEVYRIPDQKIIDVGSENERYLGVGYGYHKMRDSTFSLARDQDGLRRQWKVPKLFAVNESWFEASCDPETGLSQIEAGDSGAPLLLDNDTVIGVWSHRWDDIEDCHGNIVRIDNAEILAWIKTIIKERLDIDIL